MFIFIHLNVSFFSHSYGFGDASFGVYEKLLQRPFDWSNAISSREGSSIFGEQSKIREPKDEFLSFGAHDSLSARARLSHVDHIPPINILQQRAQKNTMPINPTTNPPELKTLKRKASDTTLDLDLSLKLNSKIDDAEEGTLKNHEVDSTNLSLSLCSQSSSSNNPISRLIKEAQQDRCDEQGKMASTLDLAI